MSSLISFTKMHGLGNDFVIVNTLSERVSIEKLPISRLGDRHIGIGFDQLLLIKDSKQADFACQIFNSDGSEAEQCGNGMRCIGRFIHEEKLSPELKFSVETKGGIVELQINNVNNITVNMGIPKLKESCEIQFDSHTFNLFNMSIGNPHAVLSVSNLNQIPIYDFGKRISSHSFYPQGTNVGFMEILSANHIRLRTFERGSGMTLACGSNACAAVICGILKHRLENKVKVELPLGELTISWQGEGEPVFMTGPAERVFEGKLLLKPSV